MEFWGVEVKSGEPLKVQPQSGQLIHISQAALGEVKDVKGAKYVPLGLKIDAKTFILGSLSAEERTQMMLDLVFEREFELSHDWKNGSVYVLGYITYELDSDDSEDEQGHAFRDEQGHALRYGNMKQNLVDVKPVSDEDEDDSESDSDDSEEDSEDDTDGSFSSEEELPKEEQQTKKRPADSAREAPVFSKKAKTSTPNNTGNKKTVPSKKVGKGPASNKLNEKNKSNGRLSRK